MWRPAGAVYLAALLAGLAAGLWPEAIYPSRLVVRSPVLPALQTVVLAQVAFGLLCLPLIVLRRASREQVRPGCLAAECGVFLLVAVPFYVAAGFLADAVAADVVRAAACIAAIWTFAVSASLLLAARPAWRPWVMLLLVVTALGLPAAYYIALDFIVVASPAAAEFTTPPAAIAWLWHLTPATFAWTTAAARTGTWCPGPAWAVLLWPGLAVACCALQVLTPRKK